MLYKNDVKKTSVRERVFSEATRQLLNVVVFLVAVFCVPHAQAFETPVVLEYISNVNFSDATNGLVEDATYASHVSGGTGTILYKLSSPTITADATVLTLSSTVRAYHVGGAQTGGASNVTISHYSGADCTGTATALISPVTNSFVGVSSPTTKTNDGTFFEVSQNAIGGYLASGNLCASISWSWGTGGENYQDNLILEFQWTEPSFEIQLDNDEASASAGTVLLDVSGDFAITGSDLKCQVQLFEKCEKSGYAGWTSRVPVSHINFYSSSPQTVTKKIYDGYYEGISDLENTSAWSANGIEVPFNTGYTCTYPVSYYCGEYDENNDFEILVTEQGISADLDNYRADLFLEPSSTNDAPDVISPDCESDPICWLVFQIKSAIKSLFIPSQQFNEVAFFNLKKQLTTKAPFAYVMPLFLFDTSDPATTSAMPSLVFTYNGASEQLQAGVDTQIEPLISTALGVIKNAIRVLFFAGFVVYLFLLVRRLLPQ